jgi:uncharacterized protein YcbK (DUF882 family)/LAS superfamily LD-carboxypeptidase LdcB/peptidoglycan hydrolase-like protein with peptidoglycan-binding domain
MNSREEKDQLSCSGPRGDLESPFLSEELFVPEAEAVWEPRLAALEAQSPFHHVFEERQPGVLEAEEPGEEFVEEDEEADADDYAFHQGELGERGTLTDYESWDPAATLEFEAAGCPGEHELLDSEGELLDSEIWQGAADQIAFRNRVLNAHLARSRKRAGAAKRDLSPNELDDVAGTEIKMGLKAAAAAGRLLAEANADLAKAQAEGHADALRTIRLSATSGYRDSAHQNKLWRRYFTAKGGYYDRTQTARERLADGPHSEQAVTYMLTPKKEGGFGLGGRIAAPGYSNHQGGIAIDFSQKRQKGHEIENNSSEKARAKWRSTWFHNWLKDNAAKIFGFQPIPTEEWHWEYRRGSGTTASTPAAASMGPASALSTGKLWTFDAKTLPTRVAVFCPQAALSMREVEVLVYAHGLLNGCKRPKSIPDGMITDAPFKLGDIVTASGRPLVLVVPYLDWANPGGESAFGSAHRKWHALGKPAHLNSLIAEVLAELGRVQSIGIPSLRNLVIAGHSRAYDFLEPLAHFHSDSEMQQGALARLSQVWAFDTTYTGDVSKWTSWLDANPGLQVTVIYRPGTKTGTVGYAFYKRRSARLAVIQAREGHCAVPGTRLRELLRSPVSATGQETEAPWDENELKSDETDRDAEDYAPDALNDETPSGQDATVAEFVREFDRESDEPIEPAEENYEVDRFDPLDESDPDEEHVSVDEDGEPSVEEGSLSLEEEACGYQAENENYEGPDHEEAFIEHDTPSDSEVVFPSGESLRIVAGLPEGEREDYWDPTGSGNPLLDTGPAQKNKKLSANLTVRELTTSGRVSADIARIDPKLVECLQALRNYLDKEIKITSGYRSWKRNKDVYARRKNPDGTPKKPTLSQHCAGRAADIEISGMNGLEISKAVIGACGPNVGLGLANTFAHVDVRGRATAWDYGGVKDSWVSEIKRLQKERGGTRTSPSPQADTMPRAGAAKPPTELVRFAQRVLNAAEGERLKDDGDLGSLTRGALERFRRKYNLGAGGVLDGATELALAQRAIEELAQQSMFAQAGVLDDKTIEELTAFKAGRGLGSDPTLDAATRAALTDGLARRTVQSTGRAGASTITKIALAPVNMQSLGVGLAPPTNATAHRRFRLTTYHVADQRELPTGLIRVPIYDNNRRKIAEGSPSFFAQLSLEGTGRLDDGRLINVTGKKVSVARNDYAGVLDYHRRYLPKRPTTYSGIEVVGGKVVQALAFHEVPASRLGIGYGLARGIPHVPFRTLAADIGLKQKSEPAWKGKGGLVPPGTHVYIKECNGMRLPDGTIHDGWFVVNDTGGGIFGAHFDVFVGTKALRKQVKLPDLAQVWFPGIEQRIPPDYVYGLKV